MDFQAEFVREMPRIAKKLRREADPPSNFYREIPVSEEEKSRILESVTHRAPWAEIRSPEEVMLFGERGPPYIPWDELTIENLGLRSCSVKLNYCGDGQPGLVDMVPEEKKWKCFLCPVKFLRAQKLHDHVPLYHAKFHIGFLNGLFHHFKRCWECSKS
jgi:hypothetical protein